MRARGPEERARGHEQERRPGAAVAQHRHQALAEARVEECRGEQQAAHEHEHQDLVDALVSANSTKARPAAESTSRREAVGGRDFARSSQAIAAM
jgi:hypothetical protein